MIQHRFVVQYNFSATFKDGEWQHEEENWTDDTSYDSFTFDPEDPESKIAAWTAAEGVANWLRFQESKDEVYQIPFRVVHRITSDETVSTANA